ncbi:MAG: tripartite tricarboxylate transporter TctB family protein [Proteobacteria bacterium]|nr:tripartite tricarboxylate transporter TctB family protein [Pseudomonadota bacterium]
MRRRNLISAIILLALGIGYAVLTSTLPTRTIGSATQPSFFPWIIAVIFISLSAALLFQGLRPIANNDIPKAPDVTRDKYVWGFVVFVVYLTLLPTLGFIAANIPFFGCLMYLYGEKRPTWLAAGAIGISVTLFFLFREVFQIRLPSGVLSGVIQ